MRKARTFLSLNGASRRLIQAIGGMVRIDLESMKATIAAPQDSENLTDDEWLSTLRVASSLILELESLGFEVEA